MHLRRYRSFVFIIFTFFTAACAAKKKTYEISSKSYEKQIDSIVTVIKQPLPPPHPALAISGLPPAPGHEGQRSEHEWVGTVNFNMRRPNYIVLHHTGQENVEKTLRTFALEHTQVSAHYLVGKDGKIYQLLNDYLRAWHAGNGRWGNITDLNSISLGVELDNNGFEPYSEPQLENLMVLLDTLTANYKIPRENIIGHGDVAPGRKIDPNTNFPWKRLAERGFGIWYDETLVSAPSSFNPLDGLRIIGYDIRNPRAAILAFKRHYIPSDESPEWDPFSLNVLYNLYNKLRVIDPQP